MPPKPESHTALRSKSTLSFTIFAFVVVLVPLVIAAGFRDHIFPAAESAKEGRERAAEEARSAEDVLDTMTEDSSRKMEEFRSVEPARESPSAAGSPDAENRKSLEDMRKQGKEGLKSLR